jgi:hypothetical protein
MARARVECRISLSLKSIRRFGLNFYLRQTLNWDCGLLHPRKMWYTMCIGIHIAIHIVIHI